MMFEVRSLACTAMGMMTIAASSLAGTVDSSAMRQPLSALPISAKVAVPAGPAWLEIAYGSVWVMKIDRKQILRIDPATNRVVARIRVGSHPDLAMGVGFGFLWVADTKDHTLSAIDPAVNKVSRVFRVSIPDETEGSFGVGEDSIWLLTSENATKSDTLSRIDPRSGAVTAKITVKPQSHAALAAFGAIWVTSSGAGSVSRVDPRTNAVVAEIAVHAAPRFLSEGEGSIWVLSQSDGTLARIDPVTNRVIATIEVGVPGQGGDLAVAEGYVWVSAEGVPLSQIDPRTNLLVRRFVGGTRDDTLRVGFGSAWIVDDRAGQIWRVDLTAMTNVSPEVSKTTEAQVITEGASLFRTDCAPCHGLGALGGGRAPDLTSGHWVHGSSDEAISHTITQGVPGTEMPANSLEDTEVHSLIAYLRSINSTGTAPLMGDPTEGENLFGSRGCSTCHMVRGKGGVLGPNLSRVGAARSAAYLIASIREPNRELSIGMSDPNNHYGVPLVYDTVTVITLAGERIIGIARNEDTFTLQLMTADQKLRSFEKSQLHSVAHERKSLMPMYTENELNASQLRDVVAYLQTLHED